VLNTNIVVKVSTGKREFSLKWDEINCTLHIETKNPPQKGKANKEILKELKRFFEAETYLVSGTTNRKKIIAVDAEQKKVLEKLSLLKKQN
jgi:uncharacterized protein (TIGR00251 family)